VKKWRRAWKLELIERFNPTWRDLFEDFNQQKNLGPGFRRGERKCGRISTHHRHSECPFVRAFKGRDRARLARGRPLCLANGRPRFDHSKDFPYRREISENGVTMSATSRLTAKAQTTIPRSVRTALHLTAGDEIAYAIEDGRVILTKVHHAIDDPFATFAEWDGEADRRAYADL
jgi:antitoxin PrlF